MTLADVAAATGGTLTGGADPAAVVCGPVEFDSRKAAPGGLFLALPGEHVDGHDYVRQALAAGAVAAVVSRPVSGPAILVADGLAALAGLAAAAARRLVGTVVVGITGSSGKTSTKDLTAALLERAGPTVAPPASFNNELGYPYTVLRATAQTRYLVLEASARGVGHIRYLTTVAPPRIGVVLNVGSAHLGEFGSREAIAAAKGELVEALPPAADGGVAILNADDPLVAAMATRTAARIVTFGTRGSADVRAADVELDGLGRAGYTLHAGGQLVPVRLRVLGEHQVGNALAAAAVALECGLTADDIALALTEAQPRSHWRMEPVERADGVLVVNDAYNANPESARAALTTLAHLGRRRGARTFAVLGPMAELGAATDAEHAALGALAAQLGISRVIAVGDAARPIADAAAREGAGQPAQPSAATWLPDGDAALSVLGEELRDGDVVLVKASRAAGLERVPLALLNDPSHPTRAQESGR